MSAEAPAVSAYPEGFILMRDGLSTDNGTGGAHVPKHPQAAAVTAVCREC